jgi:ATP-dependent helicase/nuclease subunit A
LQRLPGLAPDRRPAAGAALATASSLDTAEQAEALAVALALMDAPEWAELFSEEARTEVDIAGQITLGGRREDVSGRIDRLLITPNRITVLDYKTGRPPARLGDVSASQLRQMAAYRALAQDLYPGRTVQAVILWTAIPAISVLDPAVLDAALLAMA